jgi:hypothetical protein
MEKDKVTLCLFTDDMKTQGSIEKLPELKNAFIKIAGYTINTQNTILSFYTSNKQWEKSNEIYKKGTRTSK